jgi:hypothetical protein
MKHNYLLLGVSDHSYSHCSQIAECFYRKKIQIAQDPRNTCHNGDDRKKEYERPYL